MPVRLRVPLLLLLLGVVASRSRGAKENLPAQLAAADALRDAQRTIEAKAAYAKILQEDPSHPEANYSFGLYACEAGDWRTALRCEAKALAADPDNPHYQYGWARANGSAALKSAVFLKVSYARKCLAAFHRASELDPHNIEYHLCLMLYYQQAPGFLGGSNALADAQAAEIKKLNPAAGRSALSELYLREKKYSLAFGEYEEALRSAPDSYPDLYNFGRLALITGERLDQGLAAFRRCLALTPGRGLPSHGDVHWGIGGVLERQGLPDQARTEYLEALKEEPNLEPARQALERLDRARS